MNRITILQEIIESINVKCYLEIGVKKGKCFLQIKAPIKIAIDPKMLISKKKKFFSLVKEKYYVISSDEFFRMEPKILTKHGLDIVFIDGLHTYQQSLKDVLNALKYLNVNGVIVMHDCNPESEAMAYPGNSFEDIKDLNLPGYEGLWCGAVWKTIVHLSSIRNDLNIFVLDCDYGVGIITKAKGKQKDPLKFSPEQIKKLSYKDLERNRKKLLNLKKPQYLKKFLKNGLLT